MEWRTFRGASREVLDQYGAQAPHISGRCVTADALQDGAPRRHKSTAQMGEFSHFQNRNLGEATVVSEIVLQ